MKLLLTTVALVGFVLMQTGCVSSRNTVAVDRGKDRSRQIVLVGHGAPPMDYPRDRLAQFYRLSAKIHACREAGELPPGDVEIAFDKLGRNLREWPRTPENDPYKVGVDQIAARLQQRLGCPVRTAYNEYCGPATADAIDAAVRDGATEVIVITTMLTPGGGHSERDIRESVEAAAEKHPQANIRYEWPYDVGLIADALAEHIEHAGVTAAVAATP